MAPCAGSTLEIMPSNAIFQRGQDFCGFLLWLSVSDNPARLQGFQHAKMALRLLFAKKTVNQQPDQQNAMSYATSVFLGSSRGLVSRCNIYSVQIHTVEVTGSNPVAPTNVS
jgi:hypothetical protein